MLTEEDVNLDNIYNNLNTLYTIINQTKDTYETATSDLKDIEDEQLDLMHEISLGKPKDIQGAYKLYKRMRNILQFRYKLKDYLEVGEDFYNFINSKNLNKSDIQSIRDKSKNKEQKIVVRAYSPRVRTDLTMKVRENSPVEKKNKPFEELLTDYKQDVSDKKKAKYL